MTRRQKGAERTKGSGKRTGIFGRIFAIVTGAYKLAWRGLITAVAMGVFFGLVIGIGGEIYQVDPQRLYVMAGLSGWVSGLVAMLVVFTSFWRKRRALS